jgi:hypothetical protein
VGSGGRSAGAARGAKKGAWGSWGSGTWPAKAEAAAHRETERGGLEVDEEGLICNSPKVQGLYCKAKITFKT